MSYTSEETKAIADAAPKFILHSYREMLRAPASRWMVKGLLPDKGVGALYGPSMCGKTFLMMDLVHSVGRGEDWAGFKVPMLRPVVYCALEAGAGIGKRLKALHVAKGEPSITQDPAMHVLVDRFELTAPDNVKSLGDIIVQQCGLGALVVIDTLNRSAPGIDENSAQGIGEVIDGAQALAAQVGGMVLLVHHTGKDASKGMRGSSALLAALDVAVEVLADGDLRTFRVTKSKDGEAGLTRAFSLQSVEVGLDDDGDPVTSCVVKWEQDAGRPSKEPGGIRQSSVLRALKDAFREAPEQHEGKPMLLVPAARAFATAALKTQRCLRPAERAKAALESLVKGGHIRQHGVRDEEFYTLA